MISWVRFMRLLEIPCMSAWIHVMEAMFLQSIRKHSGPDSLLVPPTWLYHHGCEPALHDLHWSNMDMDMDSEVNAVPQNRPQLVKNAGIPLHTTTAECSTELTERSEMHLGRLHDCRHGPRLA